MVWVGSPRSKAHAIDRVLDFDFDIDFDFTSQEDGSQGCLLWCDLWSICAYLSSLYYGSVSLVGILIEINLGPFWISGTHTSLRRQSLLSYCKKIDGLGL